MANENNTFFKFMKDLITSGVWGRMSSAARALYPVLCNFTDETFKPVWPGTEKLLELTGFKSKKSLQAAKRELVKLGLINFSPGSGRTPSYYYFHFDYEGSAVSLPQRGASVAPRGIASSAPGEQEGSLEGGVATAPNQININISNNEINKQTNRLLKKQNQLLKQFMGSKQKTWQEQMFQELEEQYGELEIGAAIKIAVSRGKDGDLRYLQGILRNRATEKSEQNLSIQKKEFPPEIEQYASELKYHYRNNDVAYYTTRNEQLPISEIENSFLKSGAKVKIFVQKELPKVRHG